MPMFSFDTEVPQTGQIEHDGGRSISWRYSSSRRLFISKDATTNHDNITAGMRMSCLRFGKGFTGKNELKFFKSQRIARLSLPPVECHQAFRSSVEHHNEATYCICYVTSQETSLRYEPVITIYLCFV